jgi:magnesium chelatase family protein
MALTQLYTRAQEGIHAPGVNVEIHISNGLPAFTIVGLPEAAVRESRDRVRSAILNSGFEFPVKRITVNLAPADLPKEGGRYDLAIALGILASSQQIEPTPLEQCELYAELALGGELRSVAGLLPALVACQRSGKIALVASVDQPQAALLPELRARHAQTLAQVCSALNGGEKLPTISPENLPVHQQYSQDLAEVIGQTQAKRALELAAAGAHHMLMMGPPGTGKSMLAQRLNTILPPMDEDEALRTMSIYSVSNHAPRDPAAWRLRPFRAPHHTVSGVALVGGGSQPKPGEISLANHGVLFLDELTEFDRKTLEVLREPLETGEVHIARAARQVSYPAEFQLIAAMNPCPGGCESIQQCQCSAEQLTRYRNRLSAPLLDRIDIQIELPRLPRDELMHQKIGNQESSSRVRQRVMQAREKQLARQGCLNARMNNQQIEQYCAPDKAARDLLGQAIEKLRLSARSYHRLIKLARTIADLADHDRIDAQCITEAVNYRRNGLLTRY